MKIPFADLQQQYRNIKEEIDQALLKVVGEAAFIKGKYLKSFEENFAAFCHADFCIGTSSGTDALVAALKVADIGPGDEVIVPANSFIATSEAVTLVGAQVIFADVSKDTYNLTLESVSKLLSEKTRAVIAVNLYGLAAPLKELKDLCSQNDLTFIQDSAQAHGCYHANEPIAKYGDLLTFSFFPAKNLGAFGDAGCVVTNNSNYAKKLRMLIDHGRIDKYDHEFEGMNSRMDALQAAILDVKLKYLQIWTEKRQSLAKLYSSLLKDVEEIQLPSFPQKNEHVFHLFVIKTRSRDELKNYLQDAGIACGVHYPIALPFLKAYQHLNYFENDLPVCFENQNLVLSLPIYPELDEESVKFICSKIKDFYNS